jgi:hypothetical protein
MSARSERLYHASNINDIPTNGAPLTFVNRSELPTDQSKSQKIADVFSQTGHNTFLFRKASK